MDVGQRFPSAARADRASEHAGGAHRADDRGPGLALLDVEVGARRRGVRNQPEGIDEQRRAGTVRVVVMQHQRAVTPAPDVDLDHVATERQRRRDRGERILAALRGIPPVRDPEQEAEKAGFEPAMEVDPPYPLSRRAPSATRPLLRG